MFIRHKLSPQALMWLYPTAQENENTILSSPDAPHSLTVKDITSSSSNNDFTRAIHKAQYARSLSDPSNPLARNFSKKYGYQDKKNQISTFSKSAGCEDEKNEFNKEEGIFKFDEDDLNEPFSSCKSIKK